MTRRRIIFAIMAFIAITTAIVVLKEPSPDSNLNIAPRCDEGVFGTLSVISLVPDCDGRLVEESFDVETACEKVIIEYSHYRGRAGVLFTRVVPFDNLLILRIFLSSICQLRGQRTGLLRKLIDS